MRIYDLYHYSEQFPMHSLEHQNKALMNVNLLSLKKWELKVTNPDHETLINSKINWSISFL